MQRIGMIGLVASVVMCGACAGEAADDGAQEASAARPTPDATQLRELATTEAMALGERIGAVGEASAAGDACVAACAASYALLCVRVRNLCAAAEVVTIGGATVECATAIGVACVGGAGLAAICGRRCPP